MVRYHLVVDIYCRIVDLVWTGGVSSLVDDDLPIMIGVFLSVIFFDQVYVGRAHCMGTGVVGNSPTTIPEISGPICIFYVVLKTVGDLSVVGMVLQYSSKIMLIKERNPPLQSFPNNLSIIGVLVQIGTYREDRVVVVGKFIVTW
jgi:hypothetical protein